RALRPQDILEMLGIAIGPARQRCALLSLKVLHEGIEGPYTGRVDDELEDEDEDEDGGSAADGMREHERTGL
ncbi:MAG TPA: hypothetical protein VGP82_23760, partial [Ktedonobacterales bacterium]|nr:hypothetical protein [Ktedonobacterales bacterium]